MLAVGFFTFHAASQAQVENVIHSFTGKDGANPAALLSDSSGNLYGITGMAGDSSNTTCTSSIGNGCGTVFRLRRQSSGTWADTTLYRFTGGSDGRAPIDLAIDPKATFTALRNKAATALPAPLRMAVAPCLN